MAVKEEYKDYIAVSKKYDDMVVVGLFPMEDDPEQVKQFEKTVAEIYLKQIERKEREEREKREKTKGEKEEEVLL